MITQADYTDYDKKGDFECVVDATKYSTTTLANISNITEVYDSAGTALATSVADAPACRKACGAFPAHKYYVKAVCDLANNCCGGFSYKNSDKTCSLHASKTGTTTISALDKNAAGNAGFCYLRKTADGSDSELWNKESILGINDTADTTLWSQSNTKTTSLYGLYLVKVKVFTDLRDTAHTKAKAYFQAKRLNMKLAAAYKTSYDVYHARYAQYNGAKTDFKSGTEDSKVKLAAGTKTAYDDAVKANATKKAAYDAALADFKANRAELMQQMLILKFAVADAATAKSAETKAKGVLGAAKNGNTAATGEHLKKENATKASTDADTAFTNAKKNYDDYVKVGGKLKTDTAAAATAKSTIKGLRTAATDAAKKTKEAATKATGKRDIVKSKKADVKTKQEELDKAIQKCKETKWDAYKSTLSTKESDRDKDIATITTLLKDRKAKAPGYEKGAGAKGARCDKAMTQGSAGPKRGAGTC
jgi:hypothetical protein